MAAIDVDQWLEQWTEIHIRALAPAATKADMREAAKSCAAAATQAGIAMVELKGAADHDLETFLLERQKALAGRP